MQLSTYLALGSVVFSFLCVVLVFLGLAVLIASRGPSATYTASAVSDCYMLVYEVVRTESGLSVEQLGGVDPDDLVGVTRCKFVFGVTPATDLYKILVTLANLEGGPQDVVPLSFTPMPAQIVRNVPSELRINLVNKS